MTHTSRLSAKIPKAGRADATQNRAVGLIERLDRCKMGDRRFEAGRDLFCLGERRDAIYRLAEGWVALYSLLDDGSRQILHIALPGAVLAFVPGRIMTYGAQALTDAVVGVVPYSSLYTLLSEHPEVGMQLAWLVAHDREMAYERLSSVGRHSARERVAHLLLELFIRCRMRWPGHRVEEMHLPLTQEHIGDATGLTGVHVNRVLRDLRSDGILEFHYRQLRILDPDKLVDVAGIDPHVALSWIGNDTPNGLTAHHEKDDDNAIAIGSGSTSGLPSVRPVTARGERICKGLHAL